MDARDRYIGKAQELLTKLEDSTDHQDRMEWIAEAQVWATLAIAGVPAS
jgi:hypothetical protein